MEAAVDVKYRPALYQHGVAVDAKNPALGAIEPAGVYLECLRNHAARGHAVDGCGEFMPAPAASLRCAACGCHRSFHRPVVFPSPRRLALLWPPPHLLPRGVEEDRAGAGWEDETDDESDFDDVVRPMSPLPAPAVGYLASAPAPRLALSTTASGHAPSAAVAASLRPLAPVGPLASSSARKRFRTKFSPEQKRRMRELSDRLGWRLPRHDEAAVEDCCREIGVTRGVFKVWMHNNKHNFVGGVQSARRAASSSSVPAAAQAQLQLQPSSHHTVATPLPPPAVAASAPPLPHRTEFNINGPADYYVVQPATASGGAPQSS